MCSGTVPGCCYSSFMNRKRIKGIVSNSLIVIVLVVLFVSLLAQRLFHLR